MNFNEYYIEGSFLKDPPNENSFENLKLIMKLNGFFKEYNSSIIIVFFFFLSPEIWVL